MERAVPATATACACCYPASTSRTGRGYGIDQDEQQGTQADAATTWVGPRSAVVALETAQSFSFDDVANPDVVIWDLHEQTNATAAPSSPH